MSLLKSLEKKLKISLNNSIAKLYQSSIINTYEISMDSAYNFRHMVSYSHTNS
jgi:hypothetical protein